MVGAAVADGQLESVQADGAAPELLAEADTPRRRPADDPAHGAADLAGRRWVAGAVGEEPGGAALGADLVDAG